MGVSGDSTGCMDASRVPLMCVWVSVALGARLRRSDSLVLWRCPWCGATENLLTVPVRRQAHAGYF